jgi:hypothetical protein
MKTQNKKLGLIGGALLLGSAILGCGKDAAPLEKIVEEIKPVEATKKEYVVTENELKAVPKKKVEEKKVEVPKKEKKPEKAIVSTPEDKVEPDREPTLLEKNLRKHDKWVAEYIENDYTNSISELPVAMTTIDSINVPIELKVKGFRLPAAWYNPEGNSIGISLYSSEHVNHELWHVFDDLMKEGAIKGLTCPSSEEIEEYFSNKFSQSEFHELRDNLLAALEGLDMKKNLRKTLVFHNYKDAVDLINGVNEYLSTVKIRYPERHSAIMEEGKDVIEHLHNEMDKHSDIVQKAWKEYKELKKETKDFLKGDELSLGNACGINARFHQTYSDIEASTEAMEEISEEYKKYIFELDDKLMFDSERAERMGRVLKKTWLS